MSTLTTDALDSLLYIHNGYATARWNYVDAVGTSRFKPGGIGNGVSLTYSFLEANPVDSGEGGFRSLIALEQDATREVLGLIASVANIEFTEVDPQLGQITFGMSSQVGSSAYAYGPNFGTSWNGSNIITSVTEDPFAGNVWINSSDTWTAADWQPGGWGRLVLLHEIGHALGLKHPFESGDGGTGYVLASTLDNEAHTVMSYDSGPRTTLVDLSGNEFNYSWYEPNLSASTLMPMDIEALQHLYGANMQWETRNTPYSWSTSERILETIWDAGGIDTIDCSNQVYSCRIDLRDGQYSSVGLRTTAAEIRAGLDLPTWFPTSEIPPDAYNGANNLAIAKGAVLENATGGRGNDILLGNAVNNRLIGGAGADQLTGSAGADRLTGSTGRDVFDYNRVADSGRKPATADVIGDFASGTDRIDLSGIDANESLSGNQGFSFIDAATFSTTNATGQVRFADGVLYGSTDADAAAEFMIRVTGVTELAAADLVL